jgi:hypothetical protein
MTDSLETPEDNILSKKPEKSTEVAKLKELHPTINAIIVLFAIIMLWRGVWGLLDIYLFPGSPTFSALLSIGLGALILHFDDFSLKDLKR